jgi:CheY-like chemotaxis protein
VVEALDQLWKETAPDAVFLFQVRIHHPFDDRGAILWYSTRRKSTRRTQVRIAAVKNIRVLVVDNQMRACRSMSALLATCPQVQASQEATNGDEALNRIPQFKPDIVVMDIVMPKMNGLEATRLIKMLWPQVKVILMSIYSDYRVNALAAGADAFVAKSESPDFFLATFASLAQQLQPRDAKSAG